MVMRLLTVVPFSCGASTYFCTYLTAFEKGCVHLLVYTEVCVMMVSEHVKKVNKL